jgi:hypothetical protein
VLGCARADVDAEQKRMFAFSYQEEEYLMEKPIVKTSVCILLALFFSALCPYLFGQRILGKHLKKNDAADYFELEKGGAFIAREDGITVSGKWKQVDDEIRLFLTVHGTDRVTRLRIVKDDLIEEDGTIWITEAEQENMDKEYMEKFMKTAVEVEKARIEETEQNKKQTLAMTEMVGVFMAFMDINYLKGGLPSYEGELTKNCPVYPLLVPSFLKEIPVKDPWGNPYWIKTGTPSRTYFKVMSFGKDGVMDSGTQKSAFDRDIVNENGKWNAFSSNGVLTFYDQIRR